MIPWLNLSALYQRLQPEIDEAVQRVLRSGQYVLGEEVERFEEEFARYCGTRFAIAVNSGTSALHLALLAAGIGPGDDVITVPYTFVATTAAILYCGARPVFVDIDPLTYTLDVNQLERAVSSRTKAIVPVHLFGQPADMRPINDFAVRHGLTVIEDAAQAHGAKYFGHRVGSLGDLGCFSFYPGKNLGACGEGGCITTNDANLCKKLRMLRDWGCERRYRHELPGFNYRMDALQGAILRVKLQYLDGWNEVRWHHAERYREHLEGYVQLPEVVHDRQHVYHIFGIRVPDRDKLQRTLERHGIQTGVHYPVPVHLQPAYAELGYQNGDFPETERLAEDELSLPIDPLLTTFEIEQIANEICRSLPGNPISCDHIPLQRQGLPKHALHLEATKP